jgi:hypothetical protein
MITLAAFLKRHLPGARRTSRVDLLKWLAWYWSDARVGIVRENGRIVAVALARCLAEPEQAADPYFHDEHGRIVWVQDIVSLHPQGVASLIQTLVRRFGKREALAGQVLNRDGELRKLPWNHVLRFFNGGNSHGLTEHSRSA